MENLSSVNNNKIQINSSIDMSIDAVDEYWKSKDIITSNILTVMDSTEDWVVDGNSKELEDLINKFCKKLEDKGNQFSINKMSNDLLFILAYLHSGRAIRFIEWIDVKFPGMGMRLIQKASQLTSEDNGNGDFIEAKLLIDRMNTLKRVKQLGRIFSPLRMKMVIKALDSIER